MSPVSVRAALPVAATGGAVVVAAAEVGAAEVEATVGDEDGSDDAIVCTGAALVGDVAAAAVVVAFVVEPLDDPQDTIIRVTHAAVPQLRTATIFISRPPDLCVRTVAEQYPPPFSRHSTLDGIHCAVGPSCRKGTDPMRAVLSGSQRTRRWRTIAICLATAAGLVGWSSTASVVASGGAPEARPGTSSATTGLPSYFDGCALLTADQVTQAAGAPFVLAQMLGPEGSEAATCAYQSSGASATSSLQLLVYTAASTSGAGVDFSVDASFLGDQGLDTSQAVDVPGLGDSARYGPPPGGGQFGVLVAKSGDVRIVLTVAGDGGQELATAVATRLFQLLASSPPPPDPSPAPNSLSVPTSTYAFGDGRSLPITDISSNPTAVLTELSGDTVTGRNVYFNGYVPPEMDLRDFAVSNVGEDRMAVLQFAAPLAMRTTWNGSPVQHRIDVILRQPVGDGAYAIEIGPNGEGSIIIDPDGSRAVSGPASVLLTGNWAALVIPKSLGIGGDWTAQAFVRIELTTPPADSSVTGWELATSPVTVGSLTGEQAAQISMPDPVVIGGFTRGTGAAVGDVYSPADANFPRVVSVTLDATGGHREITVTFDRPLSLDGLGDVGTQGSYQLELRLAPPGALGAGPPIYVRWGITRNDAGQTSPSPTATIGDQTGGYGGTVPVTFDGATMHLDLALAAVAEPTPSPTTTLPVDTVAPSRPNVELGGATRRFRLNVDLTPDQCLCSGGTPPDFDPSNISHESVEVVVSGTAIALTRQSTGTTAVGALDPLTGEFEASNSTEFWSGRLDGGLDGSYAKLVSPASSMRGLTAKSTRAEGGGWTGFLDDIAKEAGRGQGGNPAPAQPDQPCGPMETYQIYAGDGVYITTKRPPPFALPDPNLGFDQNNYQNNYDFGRSLSGRWPPPGCNGASGLRRDALQSHRADESPVSDQPVTLADFAGGWLVGVSTRLDIAKNSALVTAVQFSPDVRADQLTTFSPLESSAPATAVTTVPGQSTPPVTLEPSAAPTGSATVVGAPSQSSSSSTGVIIVIVIVLLAAVAVATIVITRRKRPAA